MLASEHIEAVLTENFRANDGKFCTKHRTLINIPKANFTLRYGLEISLAERVLYHALASRLVPYFDPLIPWNVFSHRAAVETSDRYLFRRAIPAWQEFTGVTRDALSESPVLLSTDLTNYFENINLEVLRETLYSLLPELTAIAEEKADLRIHIGTLFECLADWCYSSDAGLPQNRDASSFLANIYMLPVDRAMLGMGYRYFRYMDDIKIACSNEHEARKALKLLSIELRKRKLSVNSGKTKIVSSSLPAEVTECLDGGGSELQLIDSIWQTRKLRSISRSFPLLSDLTLRLLRAKEVGSRPFRYCIRRLEALASCAEFRVPSAYFAPITPMVIDALSEYPAATDELARYLRAVPTSDEDMARIGEFLKNPLRSYYNWQNYRLWMLLVQKEFKENDLLHFALEVVQTEEDNATRCGATLYVGAFGSKLDRIKIAQSFDTLKSFLGQRMALLAVQELHYKPHIRDNIVPHLRPDLKNVYRRLDRAGVYVASPSPISITSVLDTETDYD